MAYTSAQLVAAYTAANNGVAPDAATSALLSAFAAQTQTGQMSDAAALSYVINSAQDDVQVAVQAYQFFTGAIPSTAGLDYLTNSTTNTNDLNDAYYAQFNLENRYINFAANLGLNGEGATGFASTYGGLNFSQFVGVIYETIIGSSYATAAGINVEAAKADIAGRYQNFVALATERGLITASSTPEQIDLAVKASVVGYLMAEGVKADVGIYAAGANNYVNALVNGTAVDGVDLLTTYSVLGGGAGSPVVTAPPGGVGQTIALTTGIDAGAKFTGGAGDDVFIGDAGTASAADQLNGGSGSDTLRLFATTTLPSIVGIEEVEFNNVATGTVSLAANADVTGVTFRDAVQTGVIDVTVSGKQAVSLANITTTAGTDDVDIKAAATVTAQTVNLSGVGTVGGADVDVDINGAGVDTLNLVATTAASNIELVNTGGSLETLNVSGDAKVTLTNVPGATTIKSTNTAGLTATTSVATAGGLTITAVGGADTITLAQAAAANALSSKVSVDLGAGNDALVIANLDNANNIQAGATFTGGEGTDVLNIRNGLVLDAVTGKQFSGFEVLGLGGATGTYDVGVLASTNAIGSAAVTAALAGNTVVSNLAEGATVSFTASTGAFTLAVNQKDAGAGSPDDVINTSVSGAAARTVNSVDFNDIETVNVSSTSVGTGVTHIMTTLAADEATKVTVNASTAGLTIGNLEADALVLFDASASAKAVSVTTGADVFNATAGVAFKGGAGDDTIDLTGATTRAAAPTDLDFVVTGGVGADAITLAAGGTGVDRVVYTAQADSTATKYDAVTNFTTAEDQIVLSAFGFSGTADDALLAKAAGVTIDAATNAVVVSDAAATNFFNDAGVDRAVAYFGDGADVYVFVDVNKDGDYSAGADLVVKLTGGADAAGGVPVIGDFVFA